MLTGRLMLLGIVLLLTLPALPPPAAAAELAPAFAQWLERVDPNEPVAAILFLQQQADAPGLARQLRAAGASRAERHAAVVAALRETARATQTPLLADLAGAQARGEVTDYRSHWIANLIVVRATKDYLISLTPHAAIATIEALPRPVLIAPPASAGRPGAGAAEGPASGGRVGRGIGVTPGLQAIEADRVWREMGLTGAGILVANCDTGVDGKHPALAARWRGNFAPPSECWLDVIGTNPSFPVDDDGHGTHVMGTITGLGAATGDTIGVAWNARWIASNAIGQVVNPDFDNDIIATFEWFADPDGDPGTTADVPHVIENSWGVDEDFPGYEDCDSRWWAVIDNCEAAGVATVWSAGNDGPEYYTIGSPADRIASPTSSFAVGAIDATNHAFPYPIADFSSRGPSGCDSVTLKPEVVAPGVDVYSSVPGGIYQGTGWSGTSMAGPHVVGTVALMCEANPGLTVDELKQILMDTAVDLGRPGEENNHGWGVINAYAACLAALGEHGTVTGSVGNASNGGTPVPGVSVGPLALPRAVPTGADGAYGILLPPGTYTLEASHPSFIPDSEPDVTVLVDQTVVVDFALIDIGPPEITATTELEALPDATGPYVVETTVSDYSDLGSVTLYYRVDGGLFSAVPMSAVRSGTYRGEIPGQAFGSYVEYYVEATDVALNSAIDPAAAPGELYGFYIANLQILFTDDFETGSPGWTHAAETPGFGDQWHPSELKNHTPEGLFCWKCGDTLLWNTYTDSLDATLTTPLITLAENAQLRFWHWIEAESSYAYPGEAYDGGRVEIAPAGGSWEILYPLENYSHAVRIGSEPGPFVSGAPLYSGVYEWREVRCDLGAYTGEVQLRFRFGSDGEGALKGWFIDDVRVVALDLELSAVPDRNVGERLYLAGGQPNPFFGETRLRFHLPQDARLELAVFDPTGRRVRTLLDGAQAAGWHVLAWDGRDDAHRLLPAGVYFSRLKVGRAEATHKLILAR